MALEFYIQFSQAKDAHKSLLQLDAGGLTNGSELLIAFKVAERNYIASSEIMSYRLADSFVNFDLVYIAIGMFCLITVGMKQFFLKIL